MNNVKSSVTKKSILFLLMVTASLFSNMAYAHGAQGSGFVSGLMHPVFGADHLLAMVAVGILSVQMGGKSLWAVPLSFVAVMLIGGVMGMNGILFFALETGIAMSVLVLGVAIAFDKKMPMIWSMICVGFFAMFHGYAHGSEMPSLAQPELYALGFIIATAFLHIVGISIGEIAKNIKHGNGLLRYAGASIAGIGFAILFGL